MTDSPLANGQDYKSCPKPRRRPAAQHLLPPPHLLRRLERHAEPEFRPGLELLDQLEILEGHAAGDVDAGRLIGYDTR